MGKLGAIIGASIFLPLQDHYCPGHSCSSSSSSNGSGGSSREVDKGLQLVFGLCGALALLGVLWTLFLVDVSRIRVRVREERCGSHSPRAVKGSGRRKRRRGGRGGCEGGDGYDAVVPYTLTQRLPLLVLLLTTTSTTTPFRTDNSPPSLLPPPPTSYRTIPTSPSPPQPKQLESPAV